MSDHLVALGALLAGDREIKQVGLRAMQVIGLLVSDGSMSVGTIARTIGVSPPHVSRTADRLAKLGLLRKRRDGTIVMLSATPAGRHLDAKVRGHFESTRAA